MDKYVCFDIDGVLADFESEFCKRFGKDFRNEYSLEKRYPTKIKEISDFVNDPSIYANLSPIQFGLELYSFIVWMGYKIILLTSRPLESENITKLWLNKNGIAYSYLRFTKNKLLYLDYFKPEAVFEDHPVNGIDYVSAGFDTFMIAQPWNDFDTKVPRIATMKDFFGFIIH